MLEKIQKDLVCFDTQMKTEKSKDTSKTTQKVIFFFAACQLISC